MQVETAASTTAAVAGTTFDVPLDTRVKERASPAGARRPRAASAVVDPAVAGCVVAGGLAIGMLFEGWLKFPGANLIAVTALSAALLVGLQAIADAGTWTKAEPDEWTSYAALNAIGVGVLLHD